jgi:hypothetical protein
MGMLILAMVGKVEDLRDLKNFRSRRKTLYYCTCRSVSGTQ